MNSILVGVAVGNGTGPELAAIFEKAIVALASPYNLKVQFIRSTRVYHSYSSLLAINGVDAVTDETLADADHYENFCKKVVGLGGTVIFRTSISAQALYLVRDRLQAVKVENFELDNATSVLLVRDQAQGFYSGVNEINSGRDTVKRTSYFSKGIFEQILTFSLGRAREAWGPEVPIKCVTLVYKFHLFDGLFHSWAREWQKSFGSEIQFVQGDTMNRNLLAFGIQGHQLLICANEYADIMQTMLLDRFGLGTQESAYAENVYLSPSVNCLSEYQTAHGSADDLTGKDTVNPSATLRAAAALLERHGNCKGLQRQVDATLNRLHAQNIRTQDQHGKTGTVAFVDAFLRTIIPALPAIDSAINLHQARNLALRASSGKSCLVVVDFQNDFITQYKAPHVMMQLKENIPRAVNWARREGMEIAFVRFLGDEKYQPRTWQRRNQTQLRQSWCLEGTQGAEIASCVQVEAGDRVFDKKSHYDPFLLAEFEQYAMLFDHLVVVGLFADICVDAVLRGAFQRGLWTTVIRECTAGLYLSEEQSFTYMHAVYGSEVASIKDLTLQPPVARL